MLPFAATAFASQLLTCFYSDTPIQRGLLFILSIVLASHLLMNRKIIHNPVFLVLVQIFDRVVIQVLVFVLICLAKLFMVSRTSSLSCTFLLVLVIVLPLVFRV